MIIKEVEEWNRRKSSSRIGLVNKKSKVKRIIWESWNGRWRL